MADVALSNELEQAWAERDAAMAEVREMRRHLRNLLSLVRSIARRTAEQVDAGEELRALLDGRLAAFARVQAALSRAPGAGLDLGTLIGDELLSFGLKEGQEARLRGEPIRLTPRAASLLALGTHEIIADLAVRDGGQPGRALVDIAWRREASELVIDWCEPDDAASPREPVAWAGWLIQAIQYELKGRINGRPGCWTLCLPETTALIGAATARDRAADGLTDLEI